MTIYIIVYGILIFFGTASAFLAGVGVGSKDVPSRTILALLALSGFLTTLGCMALYYL